MPIDVETSSGTLRGVARERHLAFLGVPFAGAPDGARRFLPPQPVAPWSRGYGTRSSPAPSPRRTRSCRSRSGPIGQSAGGVAVHTLLAMPAARGLFAKAIAQSGTANRIGDRQAGAAAASALLERLGIPDGDRDALRALAVDDLLRVQGARGALWPIVDGDHVPEAPLAAVRDGLAAHVPLMVGTARDEQNLYVRPDRAGIDQRELEAQVAASLPRRGAGRANEVIDVYRASRAARGLPHTNLDVLDAVGTASRSRIPALRLAEARQPHEDATFVYQVDWESPARRGTMGACHGVEVPLVFGTVGRTGDDRLTGSGPDADQLAGRMMDAWIAFARTGDPSHDGIGRWPAYDPLDRSTMIFGRDCGTRSAPFEEERRVWASLMGAPGVPVGGG